MGSTVQTEHTGNSGNTDCASCGAGPISADGYCDSCGMRQPDVRDHLERESDGPDGSPGPGGAAGVTDKGFRHSRNQDAMAFSAWIPELDAALAVVCDGVSDSPQPEVASQLAADTGLSALRAALEDGATPEAATHRAAEEAAAEVAKLAESPTYAPACTYVSAVVRRGEVTVGWVGDSRAYCLADSCALLTEDDALGDTHALLKWLGADSRHTEPRVSTYVPDGPGVLVLCSDGLWNYLPEAEKIAAAIPGGVSGETAPLDAARTLVQLALDAGGRDNVTVVVVPLPDTFAAKGKH